MVQIAAVRYGPGPMKQRAVRFPAETGECGKDDNITGGTIRLSRNTPGESENAGWSIAQLEDRIGQGVEEPPACFITQNEFL